MEAKEQIEKKREKRHFSPQRREGPKKNRKQCGFNYKNEFELSVFEPSR
jgi:hypothetical protein